MSPASELRQRLEKGPDGERHGLTLILGASPLPNLVAILALRPSWITIVCSAKTEPGVILLRQAMERCIAESGFRQAVKELGPVIVLEDAYRPAQIRKSLCSDARKFAEAALFYTGGTKPMATHIHAVWQENGGRPDLACYLADEDEMFVFDDGYEAEIPSDVSLDLETLALLHGLTRLHSSKIDSPWAGSGREGGPGAEHLKILLAAACDDPSVCRHLYEAASVPVANGWRELTRKDAQTPGWRLDLGQYVDGLPSLEGSLSGKTFEAWIGFVRGKWLDLAAGCFLFQAAQRLGDRQRRFTSWDVRALLPGEGRSRDFEVDACQVAGARLYTVSCTTHSIDRGSERGLTKLKVFEVLERARQLGGDLARSALVSLHGDMVRDEIQRDFPAPWQGDQRKPRVFGISDVRAWNSGDLTTLVEWLRL